MKSAKVVNKILLISLAFGSITFVAGILAEGNLKKTLMGLGATTSVASIAGTLLTKDKDKSNEENDVQSENTPEVEPSAQKQADYSADEGDRMMQAVEADVNPLQTEEAQTLEFVSNLNSQKEELEAQHDSNEPEIVEELEVENSDRDFEVDELTSKNEELEESLSPIDESFTNINAEETPEKFDDEPFTAQNYPTETNNVVDNVEEDINPFVSSSELSENEPEEAPNTEIADKLFGAFDPAISETDDELLIEEDSEEVGFEAASMAESELPIQELAMEDNSTDEFDFDDDSAIASESESESSMEELIMEDDSSDEFNFGEELATSTETEELNFDNDSAIASESESESSMEELVMEDDSTDEFNFGEELATLTETEESSFGNDLAVESESVESPESNLDSVDELSFEAMPMAESKSQDDFMGEFVDEDKSSEEFSLEETSEEDSVVGDIVESLMVEDELSFNEPGLEESSVTDDNIFGDLDLDSKSDESNEFIKELLEHNESAPNELSFESDMVTTSDSESDELSFEDFSAPEATSDDLFESLPDNESEVEFNLEETSEEDSNFDDLMSVFAEDDSDDNLDGFDLKFEDEDLDTINSLDAVDKKLDELSEISEDSLGELNDLLSSIQNDDPAEEKKADEVHQEQ